MTSSDTGRAPQLILASGSRTRQKMLANVGLRAIIDPPHVDEEEVKAALKAEEASAGEVAETLAELKAVRVSRRTPGALVIGADQMLECDGTWFDKARDRDEARRTLLALRGKTHRLISAAVVARDGRRIWHTLESAHLTMRPFSDAFVEDYLDMASDRAFESVGAYQLEGVGAQLFEKIEGDYFTILGLPLLPLMDFLRSWNVVHT